MPTELELIALNTEFDLYLPFSKRLVLNLPNPKDRARAAMWLQKLRSVKDDNYKKLRNEYLKLFLFALHRRSLVGVFENPPPREELESFHDGLTLLEMTRELIEITEKKNQQGDENLAEGECPLPKVLTNISYDLKEYSAMQNIPKFGAHVFYAVSNEPIQMWQKSENGVYPGMGDLPNQNQWEQALSKLSDHVLEKQAAIDARIALLKAIEAGDASPDDLDDNIDFNKKIEVTKCPPFVFKWKPDSQLLLHQNYDFANITDADNVEVQGTRQLETDEEAFTILDGNIPGRKSLVVRDPYYEGLPSDILERRHHGVVEEIPEWEDDEDDDDDDECEEEGEDEHDNCMVCESRQNGPGRSTSNERKTPSFMDRRSSPQQEYGRGYIVDENNVNEIYNKQYYGSGMQQDQTAYTNQFRRSSYQYASYQQPQTFGYQSAQMQEQFNYPSQQMTNYPVEMQGRYNDNDECGCQYSQPPPPPEQIINECCLPQPREEEYSYSAQQEECFCSTPPQQDECTCSTPPQQDECSCSTPTQQDECSCMTPPMQQLDDCNCQESTRQNYLPSKQDDCSCSSRQNDQPERRLSRENDFPLQQKYDSLSSRPPQEECTCSLQQNEYTPPSTQGNSCCMLTPEQNNNDRFSSNSPNCCSQETHQPACCATCCSSAPDIKQISRSSSRQYGNSHLSQSRQKSNENLCNQCNETNNCSYCG